MKDKYQNEERYFKAKKRVEEIKGFYGNLIAYIIVNIGLLALNLVTSPNHLWFFWPLMGWGIGVVIHGMIVFNYMPFLRKDWEEQKIKEFMEKEKENQRKDNWI
ncbi:2TM domain-containing protein [Flavobacterium sp. XN-5]|uniref:2TM domain-containing protein n=1 Tax=Flavobacterium sp. XN-5 TaxID=2599390 RepID=UPI0011CAFEDF|nr:2TM domain-containing protein [Flavobacterium sp. XN-5]NGY38345.1 2TM domain-containing protein [Flavobacterium sp. XN-5]